MSARPSDVSVPKARPNGRTLTPARPEQTATPNDRSDGQLLPLIRHLGRTLDDLENLRVRHENRRGAFERDYDTVLPPDEVSDSLDRAEHAAQLELVRLWRKHPLAGWAKEFRGVGEKSIARLIAEIGDPGERPNVAKLWAYCGYDPNRKRRKGMSQDEALACGNPTAKMRCYLIAEALVKGRCAKCTMAERSRRDPEKPKVPAPWAPPPPDCGCAEKGCTGRIVYDNRRLATVDREWPAGHKHNDALRIVAKSMLRDLWVAARALHIAADTQVSSGGAGV